MTASKRRIHIELPQASLCFLLAASRPRMTFSAGLPVSMRARAAVVPFLCLLVPLLTPLLPSQTLRQAADSAGLLIGTAVRPSLFSETAYASTLAREFNMVEAEDAMKWWVIHPSVDQFDFRQADEVIRFAQAHEMKVRGHCLVWDHTNPEWLAKGRFTSAELSHLLEEHITTVMKHYAGQVFVWDVVNEGLDENGRVRSSIWSDQPGIGLADKGTAYIEQ